MLQKILKIMIGVILILLISIGVIYNSHPIILKWIYGTARIIGKPVDATVFTNGQVDNNIKVYRVKNAYWNSEKTDDYLLSLKQFDREGKLKFINVDLKEKWVGRAACTATDCYDFIIGNLFQSESGGHFDAFQDDMKGYNFNPQLNFTTRQIKFNIPPNQLKFDSIRIELEN